MRMLVLPVPPSTNVLWRNYRGRMVKSDAARAYELEVLACARRARVKRISAPRPVAVTVRWYRGRKAGDLDNRLKAALDALRGVWYTDDAQVVSIRADRYDDPAHPRLEVLVQEAT